MLLHNSSELPTLTSVAPFILYMVYAYVMLITNNIIVMIDNKEKLKVKVH